MKVMLTESLCLDELGHGVFVRLTLIAEVLQYKLIDFLIYLERIAAPNLSLTLRMHHMQHRFEFSPTFFFTDPFFLSDSLPLRQELELALRLFIAHDLLFHCTVRISRAHFDNFASEVDRKAEADGGFELQAFLARNATPSTPLSLIFIKMVINCLMMRKVTSGWLIIHVHLCLSKSTLEIDLILVVDLSRSS
eukprot:CAMPEP_0185612930 /NCGR_PEP_ID=MMETSP0436-20130131/24217_1 /TAXON_ID=626734 ORGANISM="Favella taraikaensis, Strain Fe Narragansett Bay" /NCGR_SAMPLE_ID=MMETSP0436 /ASSEMBLY_ACC=CAM_ASM_000390 /LENGTH=192 /DNA_ID=CAMNT_0028246639 /DNA_START=427 /DNA_END=1002 /DNA_ORIENTATION=-